MARLRQEFERAGGEPLAAEQTSETLARHR